MAVRLVLGATLLGYERWFASPLPTFFHLVLAAYPAAVRTFSLALQLNLVRSGGIAARQKATLSSVVALPGRDGRAFALFAFLQFEGRVAHPQHLCRRYCSRRRW